MNLHSLLEARVAHGGEAHEWHHVGSEVAPLPDLRLHLVQAIVLMGHPQVFSTH